MSTPVTHFAIIGCGKIAAKHVAAIDELAPDARLIAVCDIAEERAKARGEAQGVAHFTDAAEMMRAHPEIDVVLVLVPTGHHLQAVRDLAPFGKCIVTEKTMALRVADCDEMLAACEAGGSHLYVVYQNRYNPIVSAARKALDEGRLGRLVLGSVRVHWQRDENYYRSEPWRGTWALDGGVISQQGSHHLDLLQWFMGPVDSVSCHAATRLLDIEVEDTGAAVLRLEDGAIGIYEATVATRPDNLEGSLNLYGERGSIEIGGVNLNELKTWRFVEGDQTPPFPLNENLGHRNLHAALLADLIQSLRTGKTSSWLVDGEEGKRNVELLAALYESAEASGAPVKPAEAAGHSRLGAVALA